jgi:hypothetical protein
MKTILLLFSSAILLSSLPSCKQCGYCNVNGNNGNTVCKETGVLGAVVDSYAEAKAQCSADGGTWTKTK